MLTLTINLPMISRTDKRNESETCMIFLVEQLEYSFSSFHEHTDEDTHWWKNKCETVVEVCICPSRFRSNIPDEIKHAEKRRRRRVYRTTLKLSSTESKGEISPNPLSLLPFFFFFVFSPFSFSLALPLLCLVFFKNLPFLFSHFTSMKWQSFLHARSEEK